MLLLGLNPKVNSSIAPPPGLLGLYSTILILRTSCFDVSRSDGYFNGGPPDAPGNFFLDIDEPDAPPAASNVLAGVKVAPL